jgi:transcription factor SFP1
VVGRQNGATGNGTAAPVTEENKDEKKEDPDRPKFLEPHLPQPSLFTTHKAWRCPNPGCNKAYKQSNGLKYHLQKG